MEVFNKLNTTTFFNILERKPIENIFNAEWIKQSEILREQFNSKEIDQILKTILNLEASN